LVPTFIGIKDNAAAAYPIVHLTALVPRWFRQKRSQQKLTVVMADATIRDRLVVIGTATAEAAEANKSKLQGEGHEIGQ
jgi:hypothetical protein